MEKAVFLERPNRFTVICKTRQRLLRAYLPNPGRLWELLLPGRVLYLKPSETQYRKTSYTVWAVQKQDIPVLLHTHYTNTIAEELINNDFIPALKGYRVQQKEVRYKNHRFDLLLQKGSKRMMLEVKSCTLFYEKFAMFPDAVTTRGRRHLETLADLHAGVLFVVHSPRAMYFLPEFHTDPAFSATLYNLRNRLFISAVAVRYKIQQMDFSPVRTLTIPWHIYETESADRGVYLLVINIQAPLKQSIAGLGQIEFKKGYYIYIGSAMNSLSGRLRRHLRRKKSPHWHIDYLLSEANRILPLPIRTSEKLECTIAEEVKTVAEDYIAGFGCSDCNCTAHLYWMRRDPMQTEAFVDIVLKYRIHRLQQLLNRQ